MLKNRASTFWALAPVMLGAAVILVGVVPSPPTVGGRILLYVVAGTLLLNAFGLSNPNRFNLALRSAAAGVLVVCAVYFISELVAWWRGKPFLAGTSSLFGASCALVAFGRPALHYLVHGEFAQPEGTSILPDDVDDDARTDEEPKR